jgi:hypothetical protein
MENIFFVAGIIAMVYLIVKFLEMRFILAEDKPLKNLIRDTLIVYLSVIIGYYINGQFTVKASIQNSPDAFTGTPDF